MLDSWLIPAKTFFLGEYAALKDQSAIVLTTSPCFELRPHSKPGLQGIHPESPAGRWWARSQIHDYGFDWYDPYQGIGGMGASSAQFLAVYLACAHLNNQTIDLDRLIHDYRQIATSQTSITPSGYDVLAQCAQGLVYLNRQTAISTELTWPFRDLGFILLHSQKKMATHTHLQSLVLTQATDSLSDLVELAKTAFDTTISHDLVTAVRSYHQVLREQNWVAPHTLGLIEKLYQETPALAIKGCGAMGADVILLLMEQSQISDQMSQLQQAGWHILASHASIYQKN